MNILHISDIHFRQVYDQVETGYKGMIAKMDNPLLQLRKSLADIKNKQEIELLLISGDLTEDGEVSDYSFLKEWLCHEIGDIPIIVTLGNHDIKANFYQGWLKEDPSGKPYNTVVAFEDFNVISFDSSIHGRPDGQMTDGQFKWLQEQLEKHQEKPMILMTHHHVLKQQSSMPPLPEAKKLLKLISGYPVLCLLNGHTHHVYQGNVNGIHSYTADGMSFVGEEEGQGNIRFEQRFGYNFYRVRHGVMISQISESFFTGKIIARVDMIE